MIKLILLKKSVLLLAKKIYVKRSRNNLQSPSKRILIRNHNNVYEGYCADGHRANFWK
jgi:hypothetical protein